MLLQKLCQRNSVATALVDIFRALFGKMIVLKIVDLIENRFADKIRRRHPCALGERVEAFFDLGRKLTSSIVGSSSAMQA
jgi:hypothetical protein